MSAIPRIPFPDIAAGRADAAVAGAAAGSGFLTLSDLPGAAALAADRATLLGFFDLAPAARRPVTRHKFVPENPFVYRGHFPGTAGEGPGNEGYDIGPDLADPGRAGDGADPLTEPTPVPEIPGWREAAARYHAALEDIGRTVTRALLRAIGADPARAEAPFARSISTLRLLRYPPVPGDIPEEKRVTLADGRVRRLVGGAHTDSGFVTLLWQDANGGLQARSPSGAWIDVPPAPDGLAVNFGQLLADWSGGRIRATEHRVAAGHAERFSVPFFFEPGANALLEPLFPGDAFAPVVYGDFLWSRIGNFPAFRGVERRPAVQRAG